MAEVKLKRYAGPYTSIPFTHYIQSPIGLVPKDSGTKTRLIFHLSYPRGGEPPRSVNANTPEHLSAVKYTEFEEAVRLCLAAGVDCKAAKSDLSSAFRHLCIAPQFWKYLVMKAQHPVTGVWYFFIDKCMPFGASISCANFQKFSDALSHIVRVLTGRKNINYLDDFFFVAFLAAVCDGQVSIFLQVCHLINFPVSLSKTVWASTQITFLGLLIDTVRQIVAIPTDKVERAQTMIQYFLTKKSKRVTLKELQRLCGFLNFLCKAIYPGRAFTRRIYAHGSQLTKPHHHLKVDRELRLDLQVWETFLTTPLIYNRPFFDYDNSIKSEFVDFSTDASANALLGAGGICGDRWFVQQWDEEFIYKFRPSINYLELFAVTIGIYNWIHLFENRRITLFCDNQSVVHMINNTSSSCPNCMILIRLIVLKSITHNVRVKACYIQSKQNLFPDLLSRLKYKEFRAQARRHQRRFQGTPCEIHQDLWPMGRLWFEKTHNKKSKN